MVVRVSVNVSVCLLCLVMCVLARLCVRVFVCVVVSVCCFLVD